MYFFSMFDTSAIKETHISVKVIWALNNPDLLMYSVENAVLNPTAPELDTKNERYNAHSSIKTNPML